MRTTGRKAAAAAITALTTGALALVAALPGTPAQATAKVLTNRFGGSDRYATAAVLAEHAFPAGSATVLVARGENFPSGAKGFPDALAANYAAGYYDVPVLLTAGSSVPAATLQALGTLKAKTVVILGGTSAVSAADQAVLESTPSTSAQGGRLTTARVAGADRYQTAAMIAESVPPTAIGTLSGLRTAVIARGDEFPDALAGGPVSAFDHFPLLLTPSTSLDPSTIQALGLLGIKGAIILGGTSAVDGATQQAIQALGISTVRLAGPDRQGTAASIADYGIAYLGLSDKLVDLARGDDYPDALAAGMEAVKAGPVPIVLTGSPTDLSAETAAWLRKVDGTLGEVDALGQQSAVSDAVLAQAAQQATCTPGLPSATTTTGVLGVLTTLLGGVTTTAVPTTVPGTPPPCNAPATTSTTLPVSTTAGNVTSTTASGPTSSLPLGVTTTLPLGVPTTLPLGLTTTTTITLPLPTLPPLPLP